MKCSKNDIENAILHLAKKFKKEASFRAIITASDLYRVSELIIVEMFVNKFNDAFCSGADYDAYEKIFNYITEIKTNGYVNFNE